MNRTDWCAPIDAYCERAGLGFWAEPVNAVSNVAFLLAAAWAFVLWRRAGGNDRPALALIGVVATVGVGSFLFHTFARTWSLLADVLPITAFTYGYFALALRRYLRLSLVPAALALAGFIAFNLGLGRLWTATLGAGGDDLTNGSVGYFPAALAMLGVGGWLVVRAWGDRSDPGAPREEAGRALLAAATIFAVSLAFRSIDLAVCPRWPLGTHVAWHGLNAVVLFLLVRAAIVFRARDASCVG
jgi:Ceramidase